MMMNCVWDLAILGLCMKLSIENQVNIVIDIELFYGFCFSVNSYLLAL